MCPNTPTRRDILKQTGIATAALTGFTGSISAADSDGQADITIWLTQEAYDSYGNDPATTVMSSVADALSHINVSSQDIQVASQNFSPSSTSHGDSVDALQDEFDSWVTSQSEYKEDSNLLLAKDSNYSCDTMNGGCVDNWDAEYEGDSGAALGVEYIAQDLGTSPSRYGIKKGDKWLNVALATIGTNLSGTKNTGHVYSSSAGDYTATPFGAKNENENVCGDSQLNTDTFDSYDHYYWDNCTGSYIRSYFGI